jgi:hypothetical protein
MFLRRPKLPVSPTQQEWIETSFLVLTDLFGLEWVRSAPLVLPTEQFFPRKWEASEEWASFAFGCVCTLMRVQRDRVELVFVADTWDELRKEGIEIAPVKGAAGSYLKVGTTEGPSLAQVQIRRSMMEDPESMIAVMAHELAHVLLLGDGKIERDRERMEPLTDLMTVFSGFGVFNANAAHIHKSGPRGWSVSRVGYMTPPEFAYSLALFAWARGEVAPPWDRELTTNVRTFMRATLKHFQISGRPV